MRNELEPSDASLLYGCFRHLAARGDVELRRLCAAQLPVLMKAPLAGTSSLYLHDTWQDLATDHDDQVRRCLVLAGQEEGCAKRLVYMDPWHDDCTAAE